MMSRNSTLLILPLLLAAPAYAQEQESGEPVFNLPGSTQPPANPNRQGPELDVFRGAPTPVTPPPITTPTITPPPPVTAAPASPAPQPPAPVAAPPPRTRAMPQPAPAQPAPPESTAPAPAAPEAQPSAPSPAAPQPAQPATEPPLAPTEEPSPWPWIAAALGALAAVFAVVWLLRRRKRAEEISEPESPFTDEAEAPPSLAPAPQPTPASPVPPTAAPAPRSAASKSSDRPWIDIGLEVRNARLSLMGATIGYSLTLHNRGTKAADDILIRTLIANADTGQQALLQQFFAGSTGLPTHSVVSIPPGESHSLTGELRLLSDQIAPVKMGDRALLIPLIALDAQYRWTDPATSAIGSGRTGRAFIVGQEKTPPADRLAPFRLDLGPRQFRAPGSRATALEIAS